MVKEDQASVTNTNTAEATSTEAKETKELFYGESNSKTDEAIPEKSEVSKEAATNETKSDGKEETKKEDYTLEADQGSLLDKESVEKIALYAKERGLSHEDAKALLQSYEETLAGYKDKNHVQAVEESKKTKELWLENLKTDQTFGGANFQKNVELARSGAKHVLDAETLEFLDQTGLGNFPGLVKAFKKVGEMLANDTFILGKSSPPPKQKTVEELFYGK